MRAGTVIGFLAACGTVGLITLSQIEKPPTLTSADTAPVFHPTTTSTTTTLAPTTTTTSTTQPTTTTLSTTGSTDASTPGTTADTGPIVPADVSVLVANAGAKKGKAKTVTSSLSKIGYDARPAVDAPNPVTATKVVYADGQLRAAQTVAFVLKVPLDAVVAASSSDTNWSTLGDGKVDVLVELGP